MDEVYIIVCPHCEDNAIIMKNEINCRIFRHAVFKNTMQPINPHASFEECQNLLSSDQIYGCAKPFIVNFVDDKLVASVCDYI